MLPIILCLITSKYFYNHSFSLKSFTSTVLKLQCPSEPHELINVNSLGPTPSYTDCLIRKRQESAFSFFLFLIDFRGEGSRKESKNPNDERRSLTGCLTHSILGIKLAIWVCALISNRTVISWLDAQPLNHACRAEICIFKLKLTIGGK